MAGRTPRQHFQRGTQMSFQGKQKEQPSQYGGLCSPTRGQDKNKTEPGNYVKGEIYESKRGNGGAMANNDEEGKIQDGESRSACRRNQNQACPSKTSMGQQGEDAFSAEKYDSSNADIVVQKVDEWLKHRSDSMSSIEFDNEMKAVEEYEFNRMDVDEPYPAAASLGDISHRGTRIGDLLRYGSTVVFSGVGGPPKMPPPDGSTLPFQCISKAQPPSVYCLYENANAASVFGQDDKLNLLAAVKSEDAYGDLQRAGDEPSNGGGIKTETDLEFEPDKNMMLMTPQELERMPESGIEFEESVGPKEFEMLVGDVEIGFPDHPQVSRMEDDDGCALRDADEMVAGLSEAPPSVSSSLATISISTDNDSNTTSIIINTKLGQQEFMVNTANPMQAAALLQPIMLADLVEQEGIPVLATEPQMSIDVMEEENSEICPDESSTIETIDAELMSSEISEKVPIKGCKREEKDPGGAICTHTGRCKKVWTCPEPSCGKIYTKQCKLKVHMMQHSGVRPYKCEVEGCDWAFTTLYKLKRHLETHCGSKAFACDYEGCTRSFTTVYNLNSHKKMHDLPNSIVCPIDTCRKHFPTRRKMELHMKEHGEMEAPYRCSVESCGKRYYTANSMASHIRFHQKTTFQCTFNGCDKTFDKLSRFKVHMWHHTGERPYICSYKDCTWAFSSASKLQRHTRKHTGERKYPCKEPGCNKSFMRLEHLQGHSVTHRGDKPFACPHENCDARFTAKSSLYVHLKKHSNSVEKMVYACPAETCDKKYNCKSSLRIHMIRYHEKLLTEAGHLDLYTLLSSEPLQDPMTIENYEQVIEQQNAISVTVQNDTLEATLMSAEGLLQSHADQTLASNIMPQHVEVATMIISEMPTDGGQPLSSHHPATICSPLSITASQSEIEQFSTMCVQQENNSGCARTDFCSNHMLMNRAQKRHQLQQGAQILDSTLESDAPPHKVFAALASPQLTTNDVILTSTAVSFHNSTTAGIHFIQNQLLSDDPPSTHGDVYQEDGLLNSMANELAVPIALLAEPSGADVSGHATDFGTSQSTVAEFTGTTINLQDLE